MIMSPRETINTNGVEVNIFNNGTDYDYISLTDIAKYRELAEPNDVIRNWLRNRNTLEYLGLWEQMNNPNFNLQFFESARNEAGLNSFVMTPKRWIQGTNAIGITSQPGRYGGTYAHSDIAFEFASWISPEFKLYLIKDYQTLKAAENNRLSIEWNLNRTLSKLNYKVHTDAIKENLLPPTLSKQQQGFKYANEADRINIALFGITAKQWREMNPSKSGNIRDFATTEQLLVLTNLESMNAEMIRDKTPDFERTAKLNDMARRQMETFLKNRAGIQKLKHIEKPK
ncbi:KilA-N domain-containing protein [Candidatus Enterococcus clewellii]